MNIMIINFSIAKYYIENLFLQIKYSQYFMIQLTKIFIYISNKILKHNLK